MSDKRETDADSVDLREAMDRVLARVTLEDIAKAADCGVNSLKQARLDPSASGYRKPPATLRRALHEVCRKQASYFSELARQLKPGRE